MFHSKLKKLNSKVGVYGYSGRYIIYILPPPILSEQIDYYWSVTPSSEASMYIPHVSVTGFFNAQKSEIDDLINIIDNYVDQSSVNIQLLKPIIQNNTILLEIQSELTSLCTKLMDFGKKHNLLVRLKDCNHFSLAYRDKKIPSGHGVLSHTECCDYYDTAQKINWDSTGFWKLAVVECFPSKEYKKQHEFNILKSWPIC